MLKFIVIVGLYIYILYLLLFYIFRSYAVRVTKACLVDKPSYYSEIFLCDHFNTIHLEFSFVVVFLIVVLLNLLYSG